MQEIINSFGLDWKIFLAEIVNFLVVIAILYFFVFKKIFKLLDRRRSVIAEGIKKTELADETLKSAEKKKSEIIREAQNKAGEKINQAIEKGKEKESKIIEEAKKKAFEILNKTKKEAENRKSEIIKNADVGIAKMVILGAEKILKEK